MVIEFQLKYPFKVSLIELQDLASTWGLKIVQSATFSSLALVETDNATFERMFATKPHHGYVQVPESLAYFVNTITVNRI